MLFHCRQFLRDGLLENRPSSRNAPVGPLRVRFQHLFRTLLADGSHVEQPLPLDVIFMYIIDMQLLADQSKGWRRRRRRRRVI